LFAAIESTLGLAKLSGTEPPVLSPVAD
jgi:hypothetical protein